MNRLDELLERFEYVAQERDYGSVNLHYLDVVYLASVLRAGRELREAAKERYEAMGMQVSEYGNEFAKPKWQTLGRCLLDYDLMMEGDNDTDVD